MRLPSLIFRCGVAVFVLVGALVFTIPTAHADPHAMFYTTIGQQQLFFNVLAALDQADYVEPAIGTRSRDELAQKQQAAAQAGLTEAQKQVKAQEKAEVVETKTDLAGVLTRGITLEGYDLWTTYLAHQFALEVARRTATDEVVRVYCERGLGLPNCKDRLSNGGETVSGGKLPNQPAFVNNDDPLRKAGAALGAAAALDSSYTGYDQQERQQIADPNNETNKQLRPWNESMAALTQNIQGDTSKELARDRLKAGATSTYRSTTLDPTIFDDIDIDRASSKVTLKSDRGEDPRAYISRYTNKLAALIGLPGAFMDVAAQGADEVTTFQALEEEQGALSDSGIVVDARPKNQQVAGITSGQVAAATNPKDYIYRSVSGRIKVPAHVKIAAADEAINALANTEQNLQYAPSRAESQPGDKPLVVGDGGRSLAGQAVLGTSTGTSSSVLGTTDSAHGQVAAGQDSNAKDPNSKNIHDAEKESLPLNTNPISVHHEPGFASLLTAIGVKAEEGGCTCKQATENVAKRFGQLIVRRINGQSQTNEVTSLNN